MTVVPDLLAANARYAATFSKGDLPRPPARSLAILTCMDARIDPCRAFGLAEGDANVIRNAGGRATEDAIRSLIIAQQLLEIREVLVIHHTDCGSLAVSNDKLRAQLVDRFSTDASELDFLPFADLEQSVRDDIDTIRRSPFIAVEIKVSGFIYDVYTGRLSSVE